MPADRSSRRLAGHRAARGFTAIELLLITVVIGAISAWAMPAFVETIKRVKVEKAVLDIGSIQAGVDAYFEINGDFPASLADLDLPPMLDPWRNPYQYLSSDDPGWQGKFRKDRFLVPLNSDYDLYSMGPDGQSRPPLRPPVSRDDIIRANNGGYIGPANEF